jgi:hypothetical protein
MNIKPFRAYSEHDVVNLFALASATGSKGTFVQPTSFNPSDYQGFTNIGVGATYDGTWSNRYAVKARVTAAASGAQNVLGMQLYDVIENDENGIPVRFSPQYVKDAKSVVCSGEAVPVLTRGIVEINGFYGTPQAGSGAFISNSGDGSLVVGLPNASLPGQKVGKFLSSTGADGYALLKIEL